MISLLLNVFSHVSSDFIFQTDRICSNRIHSTVTKRIKANFFHSLITFFTLFIFLISFYSPIADIFVFSLLIAGFHFLIDSIKSLMIIKFKNGWTSFLAFFIDQFIHLLIILVLWTNFTFKANIVSFQIKRYLQYLAVNHNYITNCNALIINVLMFLIIFVYVTLGGDIIMKNLLYALRVTKEEELAEPQESQSILERYNKSGINQQNKTINQTAAANEEKKIKGNSKKKNKKLKNKNNSYPSEEIKEASIEQVTVTAAKEEDGIDNMKEESSKRASKGKYIGILERIIIMILTINNSFTSIAFVLTAKSIVRSKRIENEPGFAEEYLIGTLGSILIGILGGCAFNFLKI